MFDFLTVSTGAELFGLTTAIICLRNDQSLIWRGQILFLLITWLVEIEGYNLKKDYVNALVAKTDLPHGNVWLYNILLIFQAVFISLVFYDVVKVYVNSKYFIIVGLAVLAVFYAIDLSQHGVFKKHNNTTLVMSILFVIYSFSYYYYLINERQHHNIFKLAPFWWVTGTLFFFFGQIASTVFFQILSTIEIKFITTYTIYKILNVILYGCWSYSFICRKWLTNKSEILL